MVREDFFLPSSLLLFQQTNYFITYISATVAKHLASTTDRRGCVLAQFLRGIRYHNGEAIWFVLFILIFNFTGSKIPLRSNLYTRVRKTNFQIRLTEEGRISLTMSGTISVPEALGRRKRRKCAEYKHSTLSLPDTRCNMATYLMSLLPCFPCQDRLQQSPGGLNKPCLLLLCILSW